MGLIWASDFFVVRLVHNNLRRNVAWWSNPFPHRHFTIHIASLRDSPRIQLARISTKGLWTADPRDSSFSYFVSTTLKKKVQQTDPHLAPIILSLPKKHGPWMVASSHAMKQSQNRSGPLALHEGPHSPPSHPDFVQLPGWWKEHVGDVTPKSAKNGF